MSSHASVPLSRSLTRMNMLVSGTALALACAAFAVYDLVSFHGIVLEQLRVQANIAAGYLEFAVFMADDTKARSTLETLQRSRYVLSAQLWTTEGETLAEYRRAGDSPLPPRLAFAPGQADTDATTIRGMTVGRLVEREGRTVGMLYIHASIAPLTERIIRYLFFVVGVLAVSLLAALLVSRQAQLHVTEPLVALAEVAQRVSAEQDYALRASDAPGASSEVRSVIASFNGMIEQIQTRDRSLQAARDDLEARVRSRTEALDATNRELEAFTYSVSHDLRAPLRHVVGFASLLEAHAGPALDGRGRGYLKTITDAANRMGRLIDDLLAFSRMGRASLNVQEVDLAKAVLDARAEIEPDTAGREIVWTIHPLPGVRADPALLHPVLVNLLSNAVKYTSTRAVAHIQIGALTQPDGMVVVSVADNGVGFDMQYAGKLFGVFQRLHRADEFGGTGIGLANVRRIIARHGGETWAEAVADRGAVFYFSLPGVCGHAGASTTVEGP